jgi:predicted nucleic acid-binding protein
VAPETYVLDTSALLALIEDEPGADRVEEVLRGHTCLIAWISMLEVHYVTQQEKGAEAAEHRYALLESLPVEFLWRADSGVMRAASRFKSELRLSLADAVIAGFARTRAARLLHKDPEYEALAGQLELESLPYKGG